MSKKEKKEPEIEEKRDTREPKENELVVQEEYSRTLNCYLNGKRYKIKTPLVTLEELAFCFGKLKDHVDSIIVAQKTSKKPD